MSRIVSPSTGGVTIETLDRGTASGRFAFEGRDLETEATVHVTGGRFEVRLTGA